MTSIGGEVNGIPIVPLPGLTSVVNNYTNAQAPLNVPLIPYQQFDAYLAFTLDGYETYIVDSQGGPFAGLTFINPGDVAGLGSDEIAMQLVDVAYSAPEPGSLALLGLGLIGLLALRSRRQRRLGPALKQTMFAPRGTVLLSCLQFVGPFLFSC